MITITSKKFIKNPIFISYTSLKDFLNCPRSYYLKNLYRDKKSGNRIQIINPYLTLGALVHDAISWYLQMEGQITKEGLEKKFRNLWLKYRGKRGGFESLEQEGEFGKRGLSMLDNFFDNAQKLDKKILASDFLKFNLVENLILNGRLDFAGELPDGSLHIIDFKTGSKDEDDATQLYIYAILTEKNLSKKVSKVSFWYLDRDSDPKEAVLDPIEEKIEWLKEKGLEIKKVIEFGEWVCAKSPNLCRDCQDYQAILEGKGELQFEDFKFKKLVYFLPKSV